MVLYFLTGNEGKLREAMEFIPEIEGMKVELEEIQSLDVREVIKHKINEGLKKVKGRFIVEDTSLVLNSLNGLPGTFIKWFEKTIGLDRISGLVEDKDNSAYALCVLGYWDGEKVNFFEGKIEGYIVKPRGDNGFGWDKIFVPKGYKKAFAEMSSEEKNKISMRSLAFTKLAEELKNKQIV